MGRRRSTSLAVLALCLAAGASSPAHGALAHDLVRDLMADIACRENDIVAGPNSVFGIRTGGLSGDRRFLLYDAALPPANGSPIANIRYGTTERPYWTLRGDLVFYNGVFDWLKADRIARRDFSPFAETPFPQMRPFLPITTFGGDLNPLLVKDSIAVAGSGPERTVLNFFPPTGAVARTAIDVGFQSTFAWDGQRLYVRVRQKPDGGQIAEQYDPGSVSWKPFAALPRESRLVFLRDARGGPELGVLVSGEQGAPDRILFLRGHDTRTMGVGQFSHVVAAPERSSIYGTLDRDGLFHAIPDPGRGRGGDWPLRLSGRRGVIDIGVLGHGTRTYALVKSESATEAPRIDVLAPRGVLDTRTLFSLCAGMRRGVGGVATDGNNILFTPGEPRRNALVVYLHGGPFDYIGEGGHWLTDAFNLAGYPIVAVNYTGSDGIALRADEPRSLVSLYGSEVSAAVAFAQEKLGGRRRPLIFVADSFGSLVGLSAIASGSARPAAFVILDGVVDALDLDPSGRSFSGGAPWRAGYLARAVHDLSFRINPEALFAAARTTNFLFVHGGKDDVAPLSHVQEFTARFNALRPDRPARIAIIPGMYHEPDNKAEMLAILAALHNLLAAN